MLKPIKIAASLDEVFLVSDTHFRHNREFILAPRGFKTVEDHDNTIIHRWVTTVPPTGTVIHLGDFCFQSDEKGFWELVRRLSFRTLFLHQGNHLSGQKQAHGAALAAQFPSCVAPDKTVTHEVYPLSVPVDGDPVRQIVFLPEYAEFSIAKEHIVCCHYALQSWHHMGHGVIHCHGHSHGSLTTKLNRRRDVGIECYGGPVSLRQLMGEMKNEEPAKTDHHSKDTT